MTVMVMTRKERKMNQTKPLHPVVHAVNRALNHKQQFYYAIGLVVLQTPILKPK